MNPGSNFQISCGQTFHILSSISCFFGQKSCECRKAFDNSKLCIVKRRLMLVKFILSNYKIRIMYLCPKRPRHNNCPFTIYTVFAVNLTIINEPPWERFVMYSEIKGRT